MERLSTAKVTGKMQLRARSVPYEATPPLTAQSKGAFHILIDIHHLPRAYNRAAQQDDRERLLTDILEAFKLALKSFRLRIIVLDPDQPLLDRRLFPTIELLPPEGPTHVHVTVNVEHTSTPARLREPVVVVEGGDQGRTTRQAPGLDATHLQVLLDVLVMQMIAPLTEATQQQLLLWQQHLAQVTARAEETDQRILHLYTQIQEFVLGLPGGLERLAQAVERSHTPSMEPQSALLAVIPTLLADILQTIDQETAEKIDALSRTYDLISSQLDTDSLNINRQLEENLKTLIQDITIRLQQSPGDTNLQKALGILSQFYTRVSNFTQALEYKTTT